MHGQHVQAVQQVLAEPARPDFGRQVTIGGCDHPNIGSNRTACADPLKCSLLKNPEQFGLQCQIKFPDFIEQQGAAISQLKTPKAAFRRAREGSLLVAEEFAFQQRTRQSRAVDGQETTIFSWRMLVDPFGGHLFAHA